MTLKQRQRLQRLSLMVIAAAGLILFILTSLQDNLLYFVTPSQLLEKPEYNRKIRLGGLVAKGSVTKDPATVSVNFTITDQTNATTVHYRGVVPDLFREGQGVIAEGKLDGTGVFIASSILAKHDENYQPPELKGKIK